MALFYSELANVTSKVLRTDLSPNMTKATVKVPKGAEAAFKKPTPIGPMTTWQRVTGQQFTPKGKINMSTG